MAGPKITAAMLYDLVHCAHRVSMDLMGAPIDRGAVNPFIQLLWEKGNAFEQEVIEDLELPFTNLRSKTDDEKERLTWEAIERGDVRHPNLFRNPGLKIPLSAGAQAPPASRGGAALHGRGSRSPPSGMCRGYGGEA